MAGDWRETVKENPFPPGAVEAEMDRIEYGDQLDDTLLDDVAAMIRRYVSAGAEQIDTLTLWIVHTHAIKAFYTTGRLYITSPEANCGKSVTLTVLGELVANPLMAVNISPAAMYRSMEKRTPTFLIDEIDRTITTKAARESESGTMLLAVLNGGYRRGATVPRCVGPKQTVVEFPTFAPVAMAGITAAADQPFMSRSIPIVLQRAVDDEMEELEWDRGIAAEFKLLHDRIARWSKLREDDIEMARPERPVGLKGRNAEIWMPLLRIADVGGGDWLERSHLACERITLWEAPGVETPAWELLRDTELAFRLDDGGFLSTRALIERLHALDDSDWQHWNYGKGLTPKTLAKLLAQYGVHTVRRLHDGEQSRGYEVAGKLSDAWKVYVDPIEDRRQKIEDESSLSSLSLFSSWQTDGVTPVAEDPVTRSPEILATTDAELATTDTTVASTASWQATTGDVASDGDDLANAAVDPASDGYPDVEPF